MTETLALSRISKLFLDRDETSIADARARREQFNVTMHCGADLRGSYTSQLAVLTAASIAVRCFPGAVRVSLPASLASAPLLIWPRLSKTFGNALSEIVGPTALVDSGSHQISGHSLTFGDVVTAEPSLRVTFDGWIAKVGPSAIVERLPEREFCSLAGIAAAALGMSELFLSFANVSVEATHRVVALSLWRPDLDVNDTLSLGIRVEFLPRDLWVLGLGHLGNGYLWALATLPYADPGEVELSLMDFDKVITENVETGIIFQAGDVNRYKTRACSTWLERHGFTTKLVERHFDCMFRCGEKEARLALCGFDSYPARRNLGTAAFSRVVEAGLGGTANNFDTIALHTLPHDRPLDQLWPDPTHEEQVRQRFFQEKIARTNRAYAKLANDECGRYDLAGKAVAVPFVGAATAALVAAETIRLAHGGMSFTDMKVRLGAMKNSSYQCGGIYTAQDLAGITFCAANRL